MITVITNDGDHEKTVSMRSKMQFDFEKKSAFIELHLKTHFLLN